MPTALFQVSMTSARTDQKHIAKADELARGSWIAPARTSTSSRSSQVG